MTDIIVIGGGAAGCMAALAAARRGARVTLLERNPKLGRKLYITGKGRCNVTNDCAVPQVLRNVPHNSRFLTSAVTRFPPESVKAFFEGEGVPLKTERGGRVFPCSDQAFAGGGRTRRGKGSARRLSLQSRCHRHGRRILSADRLDRRRIRAGPCAGAYPAAAQALSGPAGGRGGSLRPDAGALASQCGSAGKKQWEKDGLCRSGRTFIYPFRPVRTADPQRQRPHAGL